MANDSLSQTAKYLIDVETKTSEASAKRLFDLMDGLEVLFGKASGSAKQAAEAFKLKGSDENLKKLQATVGNLGKAMRDINTAGGNVRLLSDNEVTRVLAVKNEVEKLDRALKQLAQNNSIKEGTLGLDAGSIEAKVKALKVLEAAQRANNLAVQEAAKNTQDDGAKGKAQYEQRALLIAENIRLIKLQTQALQEAANQKKAMELQETAGRKYQYQQVLSDEKKQLMNQLEQRRQYLREKSLMEQRQAQEYLNFQPNVALRQAFGATNPQGASTLQRVNLPGTVPEEQIKAQRQVLDLQNQIIQRVREGLPVDQAHLALIEQVIAAKRREAQINSENLNQIREQEAAQRRLSLASGAGAASLLAIQAALRVNGLVLNALQNSLRQALTSSIAVEAEFKNVQAVTATTNTEMTALEETIKRTAGSTKFSAKEVAEAALVLGQAGLSAQETAAAIPAVAMLATAAGTSLAQAVSLTTSVLGIFDKQASETADIANKITQAANSSKVSVEKLALGFQYAGNIAHLSGVSFEETTAAMAAMSNAGILNGSTLGSGLRSFLTEVQKPSQEFISTLARIGLGLDDVDFKAHGLLGVTNNLRQAGFVATDAIKSFDIRGAAAFNALVANPEDLERQYKNLLDTNAATKANEIQMDSLSSQAKRLQTSLENLAGTGFAPLSQVLKDSANNLANMVQHATEASTTVQVLGVVLGTLAVVATAKFAISLAAGALQLAQFEVATVAAVRAIGTMTIAQSVGAVYGVLGTIVTSVTVAIQGLAAGAYTATGALTALWTALKGMSLLTSIGIALAVATAGYYAYSYASGQAAREVDKATAAVNTARGAFEEKSKVVNTLDENIKNLTYRQNSLTKGSSELRLAVAEANSKFGDQISVMDINNTSAKELIGTLQKLRAEQVALRAIDQDNANTSALKLKNITEAQAKSQVTGLSVSPRGGISAPTALDSVAQGNQVAIRALGLSPEKMSNAAYAVRTGDLTPESSSALSSMQTALPKLLEANNIIMTDAARSALTLFLGRLPDVMKTVAASRQASVGFEESSSTMAREKQVTALKGQTYGSGTIGSAIGPTPALLSQIRADNPDADSVEVFNLVNAAIKDLNGKNKELVKFIKKISPKGDTAAAEVVQEVNVQMAELDKQRSLALTASEALAKRQNTAAEGTYTQQLRVLKKQAKSPARDKAITNLESSNEERKLNFSIRGLVDPDQIAEARDAAKQQADARLEADLMTRSSSRVPPSQENKVSQRAAKLAEKAQLAAANADKSLAALLDDFDAVQKLFESGTGHLQQSGVEAQRALKAEQADKRKAAQAAGDDMPTIEAEFAEQARELQATTEANLISYITSFQAFRLSAKKQTSDLLKSLAQKKLDLDNFKLDNEERIFTAGGTLRDLQVQQATQKYTGRTDGGSLEQQANQERLKLAEMAIVANQDLLTRLGDGNTGLIGDQTKLLAAVTDEITPLAARVAALKKMIPTLAEDDIRKPGLVGELQVSSANLNVLQDQKGKYGSDSRGLREQKRTATNNENSLELNREDIKAKIPVEFTTENVQAGLENAVNQWKDAAANLDIVKGMADGLRGTFNTFTDGLSKNFMAIADGTKSVKDGFRDMAVSVIQSIGQIASQMAAQAAVKALFGLALSFVGGGISASGGSTLDGAASAEGLGDFSTTAATGGYINDKGTIERVRHFARGGPVTGGTKGRDSVPALLMPNEFVMNTSAVDAVGTDFLHGLNQQTNSVASSSSSSRGKTSTGAQDNTVNVWIVSPDQQQPMGPKDVVAIIADDITRGGNVKKLIKSVQTGNV